MKVLIPLSLVTLILLIYALWVRDWLKSKPWAQGFFAKVEPIEILLFKKSETILFSRVLQVLGVILTFLQQFNGIDLTPILPLFPEKYHGIVMLLTNSMPLIISLLGWMVEKLRNSTTKPLELVAVPDKVLEENPTLANTIAAADATKAEAVEVAKAAVEKAT